MKRVIFAEPPIIHASLSLSEVFATLKVRKAQCIFNMLIRIGQLRPEWLGNTLPPECIYLIGMICATEIQQTQQKREDNAVVLRFNFDFNIQWYPAFDMIGVKWTEFDTITVEGLSTRFSINFYWWPVFELGNLSKTSVAEYMSAARYVATLIPERLIKEHESFIYINTSVEMVNGGSSLHDFKTITGLGLCANHLMKQPKKRIKIMIIIIC